MFGKKPLREGVTGIRFREASGRTVVGPAETDARNHREPAEIGFGVKKLVEGIDAKTVVVRIQRSSLQIDRLVASFCSEGTVQP